ncbi:MAG: CvpA family protein [Agathobacter sp.]|nr:CvpA family protein [Agathobacter sp.]
MNILVLVVLAVLLVSIFAGYKNGFLKTVLSLVSWLVVLVACYVATPMVTDFLIQNTEIETTIQGVLDAKIDEMIQEAMEEAGLSELQEAIPEDMEKIELPEELQAALPEELRELFSDNEDEMEAELVDTAAIAEKVVEIISLLLVLVFTRCALLIVNVVLGIASKLPLIGPLDRILGLVCGAGKGVVFTWIILTVVSVLALTGVNTEWAGYIAESELLTWLQNNNVILNLIVK